MVKYLTNILDVNTKISYLKTKVYRVEDILCYRTDSILL